MKINENPQPELWAELCRRAEQDNSLIAERVAAIVEQVAKQGDSAIKALAEQIDGVQLSQLEVSAEEIEWASEQVSEQVKRAIEVAMKNISAFHEAQMPSEVRVETQRGVVCV